MFHPNAILLPFLCFTILACNNSTSKQTPSTSIPATEDTMAQMPGGGAKSQASTDEQLFETALGNFKTAVEQNSEAQLESIVHFPLLTTKEGDKLTQADFKARYNDVFHADVRKLLPKAGEEHVKEVADNNTEDYYKNLREGTDKDSKLYEVYMQYPEKNTQAESYFAFVFGKVKGEYKVLGYYSKWPVTK